MIVSYHSSDADKIAEFAYHMVCRSAYEIYDDYVSRESGKYGWCYTAIIKSNQKRIVHLNDYHKPEFNPDGLLYWDNGARTIFLNSAGNLERL